MNCKGWADTQKELEVKVRSPRKCEPSSLCSSPLPYLFSLGYRPAVLRTGEREAWVALITQGQHIGPRDSVSARWRGGRVLIKNNVTQRERQGPKSPPECRQFAGMGKKMRKMYEK